MGGKTSGAFAVGTNSAGAADLAPVVSKAAGVAILKSIAGLQRLGGRPMVSVERSTRKTRSGFTLRTGATGARDLVIVVSEAAGRAVLKPAAGLNGFRRRRWVFRALFCVRVLNA